MDDFLLDAPKSNYACNSIEDLQLQLAELRQTKVTDTKAEHISATFEFRSATVFNVPENENEGADAHQNLDPALGASPAATPDAPVNGNGGAIRATPATPATLATPATPATTVTREIRAHDTLMNQPADDPALQKAVAKLIITFLGSVDGSAWMVRSVSRGASGWTFQYLCRNSTQAWQRQNSKNAAKVLVGESSGKDGQDPVNLARPAFDCRGSVTVAFVKTSRLITVKLDHTPFHKTVADLAELYKPPPPPPPPARVEVARRKDGEGRKRKIQAVDGAEGGENGQSAKKSRKKKKDLNPEDPKAQDQQVPKPKKPRKPRANKSNGASAQAEGDDQQNNALLNLSPSEAARRRDEATRRLTENGIDANTLSSEQFDIFSNQSPDLQNESLAMLIKYGAERLRIVHPNKDDAVLGQAPANGATPEVSTKKKKARKKALNEDGTPKVKKTRGSCQACRAKKSKCSKAKPECTECVEAGIACYYPPEQKRKSQVKSAEVAVDEADEPSQDAAAPAEEASAPAEEAAMPAEGAAVAAPALEQEPEPAPEEEASDLGSPGFNSQPPDTSPAFPGVSHDLYQPAATGLSYPQAVVDGMSTGMDYSTYATQAAQQQNASSGMAYPHQPQPTSTTDYPDSVGAHPPVASESEPTQAVQAPAQPALPTPSRPAARRHLPSGPGHNHGGFSDSATNNATSWQAAGVSASTTQSYSGSPSGQSRNRKKASAPAYEASQHEGLQAAASLSQAALQKAQSPPSARRASPFQNPTQAARAKSRQGQRSQSHTTASPFRQVSSTQPASVDAAAIYNLSAAADSHNLPNYDQYSRYNTTATQNTQATSRGAYEPYSQHTTSNSSSTSYPSYDAYNARSQASTSSSLAAPVTQTMSTSHKKTAAPSPNSWSNSAASRDGTSYNTNNVAATANSTYGMPASSNQQQPAAMQSFNVRPQPTTQPSRTSTPASYGVQQPTQQNRQQQPSYGNYPSQSQSSSNHQQQQDWYGFGSTNHGASGYGSNSRGGGYGQSSTGNGAYNQHRAMNLSGNTYQNMNDQELYEMLRNNPSH